jgi:hypothetical protein
MPCGTDDGLSIVIVTVPALAESDDLSNLRLPLGSALRLRFEPLAAGAGVLAGAGVELAPEELLPPPPQPAAARAVAAAPRTSNFGMRVTFPTS